LMDIQMPRKTGIDAVRELRALPQFATTPILAITAHARNFLPSDIVRAGFDHVVFKPFEFTEIIDWIENAGQRV
jgi:CheY-like chemotaxis protein